MISNLTIVRYPSWMGWGGFLSMAFFRWPLQMNQSVLFWKLMGCGKNGSFDKTPDLRQWAVLTVHQDNNNQTPVLPSFLEKWWKLFGGEKWTLTLEAIEGHGSWDHQTPFGNLPKQSDYEGPIAILTRATIRISQLERFWSHVDGVANQMKQAEGFITSVGIGEIPWIKQATLSIWRSKEAMKHFAYKMKDHAEVVRKTRQENWYSEEMFIRFKIISSKGTLNGVNPFNMTSASFKV